MTTKELFKLLKKRDKCLYKSIVRDIFKLYQTGIVNFKLLRNESRLGNIYEVWLN